MSWLIQCFWNVKTGSDYISHFMRKLMLQCSIWIYKFNILRKKVQMGWLSHKELFFVCKRYVFIMHKVINWFLFLQIQSLICVQKRRFVQSKREREREREIFNSKWDYRDTLFVISKHKYANQTHHVIKHNNIWCVVIIFIDCFPTCNHLLLVLFFERCVISFSIVFSNGAESVC